MNAGSRHERSCRGLFAVVLLRALRGHVALGQIAGKRGAVAAARIAVAAAAGALQEETIARLELVAAGRGLALVRGAEGGDEAAAGAGRAAGEPARREARLVEAADDGGVLQDLVFALQAQAAAPLSGATGVRH